MPKAITYIDLFSGIGGFREGLSRAGGFVCVGHCEIDKYADQSYRATGCESRKLLSVRTGVCNPTPRSWIR